MRTFRLAIPVLLALAFLVPAANACQTIYWVKQGNQDRYYNYGEEVRMRAGAPAVLRIYWPGKGGAIQTTSTAISHPHDFGLEGYDRRSTSQVVRMRPQEDKQYAIGKINLVPKAPGYTLIGYRIDGVGRGTARVPPRCLADTVAVRVVR